MQGQTQSPIAAQMGVLAQRIVVGLRADRRLHGLHTDVPQIAEDFTFTIQLTIGLGRGEAECPA